MKKSYKRVIDCLQNGGRVWVNSQSNRAYLCKTQDNTRYASLKTLDEMEEQGLLVTTESGSEEFPDTDWKLPPEPSKMKVKLLVELDPTGDVASEEEEMEWLKSHPKGEIVEGHLEHHDGDMVFRPDGTKLFFFEDEYEVISEDNPTT